MKTFGLFTKGSQTPYRRVSAERMVVNTDGSISFSNTRGHSWEIIAHVRLAEGDDVQEIASTEAEGPKPLLETAGAGAGRGYDRTLKV